MELLVIAGVDLSHLRLVDLASLADRAKPFYDWVEQQFQLHTKQQNSLHVLLSTLNSEAIRENIQFCYKPSSLVDLPRLFDGVGRTYPHSKACYYFFSWLIRDAPQQRLSPLIQKVSRSSGLSRLDAEIDVLTALICEYRSNVKTFQWEAIREIIIDRLEGSRRSIKGHEKETIVRTAIMMAIQDYFERARNYGTYASVETSEGQVTIGNETYDIAVNLLDIEGQVRRKILIPIKTRETEGGGHSHLFTRDILSAINTARIESPNDILLVIIVAKNWSPREAGNIAKIVDHLIHVEQSPGEFIGFRPNEQSGLNRFIADVLDGKVSTGVT